MRPVDVEADDVEALLDGPDRQGQADIALADDDQFRGLRWGGRHVGMVDQARAAPKLHDHMRTRTLIILALLCGIAILAAFAAQLLVSALEARARSGSSVTPAWVGSP